MRLLVFLLLVIISSAFSYAFRGNELAIVEHEEGDKTEVTFNAVEDFRKGKRNFVPTIEWQVVEEDQMIPPGLHIRLNMKTGKKEAKLLDQHVGADDGHGGDGGDGNDPHGGDGNDPHDGHGNDPHDGENKHDSQGSLTDVMKEAIEDAMRQLKLNGSLNEDGPDDDALKHWNMTGKEGSRGYVRMGLEESKPDTVMKDSNLRFRSMNEIRGELKDMHIDFKMDSEIVRDSLEEFKRLQLQWQESRQHLQQTQQRRLILQNMTNLLTRLEYYMHQIDNANVLTDLGGLEVLWKEVDEEGLGRGMDEGSLEREKEEVEVWVMLNIAAISQSNPHSQVALIKSEILPGILNIIINTTSSPSSSSSSSHSSSSSSSSSISRLQLASLSALSAGVRNFPFAQQVIAEKQAYSSIILMIHHKLRNLENNNNGGHDNDHNGGHDNDHNEEMKRFIKFTRKFVTLITDIWQEKVLNEQDDQISQDLRRSKAEQYDRVGLLEQLTSSGWCDLIGRLFVHVSDLDYRENMLQSMVAFKKECPDYAGSVYMQLNRFKVQLQRLMDGDDDDDGFFKQLHSNVDSLLNRTTHVDL